MSKIFLNRTMSFLGTISLRGRSWRRVQSRVPEECKITIRGKQQQPTDMPNKIRFNTYGVGRGVGRSCTAAATGINVGLPVGSSVGSSDGVEEGDEDGDALGMELYVGPAEGCELRDGSALGAALGSTLG